MRWNWKIKSIDTTSSWKDVAGAQQRHENASSLGVILGVVAAVYIYSTWMRIGYENKWVEYTLLPAVFFGGLLCSKFVYAIAIRIGGSR